VALIPAARREEQITVEPSPVGSLNRDDGADWRKGVESSWTPPDLLTLTLHGGGSLRGGDGAGPDGRAGATHILALG
jgi:hypothetical protein